MSLTKEQKFDMIRDVELRLAKEELAEQYLRDVQKLERSEKPLRELKDIVQKEAPPVQVIDTPEKDNSVAGLALQECQRDEWHTLNAWHFEELKNLEPNTDLKTFAAQKQEELNQLLARHGRDRDRVEHSQTPLEEEQAILYSYEHVPNPEIIAQLRQGVNNLTDEQKQLLEQSEVASKTPSQKPGLDSLTRWQFIGFETLAMQNSGKKNINIQEQFANAKAMSNDNDMGMER